MALSKYFQNFGGINFRTPELLKSSVVATDLKNVRLSENFGLSKRRGYQNTLKNVGGNGRIVYNNVNLTTGVNTPEDIVADSKLRKVVKGTITITLVVPGVATSQVKLNPTTQRFELILTHDAVTNTYDLNLGPTTLQFLKEEVEADGLFALSIDGALPTSTLSELIETTLVVNPNMDDELIHTVSYTEEILGPGAVSFAPFASHWANIGNPDWEINSFVQLNDVLYITNKNDGLFKYDGLYVYKAGLPKPNDLTTDGTSNPADPGWTFRVLFRHEDNKDNIILSEISDPLEVEVGTSLGMAVNISNIENQGYETSNLSIELYRTIEGGTVFYLVDTKDVADAVASVVEFDNAATEIADDALILLPEYVFTERNPVIPPKCSYATSWRNQLALTGDPTSVNTVYVADIEAPEGFDLRNSFLTGSKFGNANSGIKELDNHLFVFKPQSIFMVSGDIATGVQNVQVDTLADDGVGCVSHNSIVETYGRLYFLAPNGIYSVNRDGLKAETDDITPLFVRPTYQGNRAVSFYWPIENKILFLLPNFSSTLPLSNSKVLIKDIVSNSWFIWDNFNFVGGIALNGTNLVFSQPNISSTVLDLKSNLDYADHTAPISFSYKTHWESLGEPAIYKKFLRIKCYTLDSTIQTFDTSTFTLTINTQHNYATETNVSQTSMTLGIDEDSNKILEVTKRLSDKRCRSMRVDFSNNTVHENVLISGFELEYVAQYGPTMKDGR